MSHSRFLSVLSCGAMAALDVTPTPVQAIDLTLRRATASQNDRRHLADEQRSIGLPKAERLTH